MNNDKFFTLITGGSMGIGKALAHEFASRNMNLVLVALDCPELKKTANEIRKLYNVDVHCIAQDITEINGARKVYDWCKTNNIGVDILINNAGRGNSGLFEENNLEDYLQILDLNNKAMIQLTYHFIKDLKKCERAFIMNTSSMEATLPLPYKAVYTGSKNFIYSFSMALGEELRQTSNIKVSVLCPGSVITNDNGFERIKTQGSKTKVIQISANKVAKIAVRNMLKGERVIVPGFGPWAIVKIMKYIPTNAKMRILERLFRVYSNTGSLNQQNSQLTATTKSVIEEVNI